MPENAFRFNLNYHNFFKFPGGGMLMLRISLSALRALCGDSSVPPLNHLIISVQIIHYGP